MDTVKTVVWDLDGTLIDSFGIFSEVLRESAGLHRIDVPDADELVKHFHGSLRQSISSALGGLSGPVLDSIEDDFLRLQIRHYEVVEHHLFQDALGLVRAFHTVGARQLIVTNRNHEGRLNASPRSIVENSSLKSYINQVICGDDTPYRKPKPEVLAGCVLGPDLLVVGDQFVDVDFAHNLGADAIIVDRASKGVHGLESLTHDWQSHTRIVSSLEEIAQEIKTGLV